MATSNPASPDTLIAIKLQVGAENRRFKLPLRELGASTLPDKLRTLLAVPASKIVTFERYSDSAGTFVTLDSNNPSVYKQLYRAAKAKLKLRIRATITEQPSVVEEEEDEPEVTSSTPILSGERYTPPTPSVRPPSIKTLVNEESEAPSRVVPIQIQDVKVPGQSFSVFCNECEKSIPGPHWHCSICEEGDYDLCRECVGSGVHCKVDGHFLIKRIVENGLIISSNTQRMQKKPEYEEPAEKEVPGAFTTEKAVSDLPTVCTRICNCCILTLEESSFVTCTSCEDYDLCLNCLSSDKHGHHPAHVLTPVSKQIFLTAKNMRQCAAGRSFKHAAICDACDKTISGIRHKCLQCPDWDFCPDCYLGAAYVHPGHRFVPVYESIQQTYTRPEVHIGITCDGPLCKDKRHSGYIRGDRYKCAVCHDTDFCSNCEAYPLDRHNRSHPLIKMRTPIRGVSISAVETTANGVVMPAMGDRMPTATVLSSTSSKATETVPPAMSANAATQVQTIAEVKPVRNLREIKIQDSPKPQPLASPTLDAHFVRDTIPDGTKLAPGVQIQQVWVLRNPGPDPWPKGCSVRYVGGDNMLNVESESPSSTSDIDRATESNVINRVVDVGEEVCFFVTIKTPKREGKAISYWRLKAANGMPFGHRLWCDIDVVKPEPNLLKTEAAVEKKEEIKEEVKEEVKEGVKEEATEGEQPKAQSGRQLLFPKLDKESPLSSTHEDHFVPAPSSIATDEHLLAEDDASLALDDGETTSDDGFLTDEEYEMLGDEDEYEVAVNGRK